MRVTSRLDGYHPGLDDIRTSRGVQVRSEKRGHSEAGRTVRALDMAFLGAGWPVHASYVIDSRNPGGPFLVADGDVVGYVRPITDPTLPDAMARLDGVSENDLVAWASRQGAFGVVRPSPFGESVAAIRDEVAHLARTRGLLHALQDPPKDSDALLEFARAAAGHLVDAGLIAEPTGIRGTNPPLRSGARADLQALHALGMAVERGLRGRVLVSGLVTGDRQDMRLQGGLAATTPLASAFLRTLAEAGTLRIGVRAGERRLDWRQPRPCERCNTVFMPVRENQRWCSAQCRWAASKTGGRA